MLYFLPRHFNLSGSQLLLSSCTLKFNNKTFKKEMFCKDTCTTSLNFYVIITTVSLTLKPLLYLFKLLESFFKGHLNGHMEESQTRGTELNTSTQ
jgi:hypothetical protein